MENINVSDLQYLLGLDRQAAFSMICKVKGMDPVESLHYRDSKGNDAQAKVDPLFSCSVKDFDEKYNHHYRLTQILDNIRNGFLKDKTCMDFLYNYIRMKVRPSKFNGVYPRFVFIPGVLKKILSKEDVEILRQRINQDLKTILEHKYYNTIVE